MANSFASMQFDGFRGRLVRKDGQSVPVSHIWLGQPVDCLKAGQPFRDFKNRGRPERD